MKNAVCILRRVAWICRLPWVDDRSNSVNLSNPGTWSLRRPSRRLVLSSAPFMSVSQFSECSSFIAFLDSFLSVLLLWCGCQWDCFLTFYLWQFVDIYRNVEYFCTLTLYFSAVLNSLMSSSGILDVLCIPSWHLHTATVAFLPFHCGALSVLFLTWLLWPGLPIPGWMEVASGHPCRVLSLDLFTTEYEAGCGLSTHGLYHAEVCSLCTHFLENVLNHEWMLNFVRSFFHHLLRRTCGFYSLVC